MNRMSLNRLLAVLALGTGLANSSIHAFAAAPCRIEVVDKENGWPVPLVQLRTTHNLLFVTDNAGVVALDAPELMGREVWFEILGHGYEVKKDGFGMRGVRLKPEPGKTLKVEVTRAIVAKRLGRLTGTGLFAESQKLGGDLEWHDADTVGSDSVLNAVYRGKMFWAWGDTSVASYPLGLFDTPSATTAIQPLASFEPPLKLKFDYFTDARGKTRNTAKMPGDGPTWITAYTSLPDKSGTPRLVGSYMKIRNHLEVYEWGLCVWNDATSNFDQHRVVWKKTDKFAKAPPIPEGHPALWTDASGKEWILFGNPFPKLRCPATFEAWENPTTWEVLKPQATLSSAKEGTDVKPHTGSIAWNDFRRCWVTVFMQSGGKPSALGELWYAEAPAPTGPWGKAVKVLTHENYTFYNPRLHPEFTPTNSPVLLFEGTYTAEFANKPYPTPRYNYNQMLYRLDLDDAALKPAHE